MARITIDHMPALARGAAALGAGGGGDPYVGRLMAENALSKYGPVDLVDVHRVPEDAKVFPVAVVGAPTVLVEKLPSAGQVCAAIESLARYLNLTPTHVACIEAGGVNSTVPIVAAARMGLPLIDGDAMGRAFPELQMTLPSLHGVNAAPLAVVDDKGNRAIMDTIDGHWGERLARTATVEMGCVSLVSMYPMSGSQVRASFVAGTLSRCIEVGRAVEDARLSNQSPVKAAISALSGRQLMTGKVCDISRHTTAGFARGEAVIEGMGADLGKMMRLQFQNEFLVASLDGENVVTTPDLVIVLDSESGEPITTEWLRYGHRVTVIGAPCDPRWHSSAGSALVGPRYFGYETDPVKV